MKVQDFEPGDLPKWFSALIIGKRRSGKTFVTEYLVEQLYRKHKFTSIYLFSSTSNVQTNFKFIPDDNKYDFLNEGKLQEIYQKGLKDHQEHNELGKPETNTCVIIDDMISSVGSNKGSLWSSDIVNKMAISGRHSYTSIFILTQNSTSVNPMFRKNLDALITFRSLNTKERNLIVEEFLCFSDDRDCKKKGQKMYEDITGTRYEAMVIDNYKAQYAKTYTDYVFKLLAKEVKGDFVIGEPKKAKVKVGELVVQKRTRKRIEL